jgi:hypothetical protein
MPSVVIPALGNITSIIAAAMLADSMLSFAAIMIIVRLMSSAVAFLTLPMMAAPFRVIAGIVRDGQVYLSTETVGLVIDHGVVLLTSHLITREQFGVLGVCRQFISVGDSVGWSRLLVVYPSMCASARDVLPRVLREMRVLALATTVVLVVGSVFAGLFIYQQPIIALYAPIALLALMPRYIVNAYESILRAVGDVPGIWKLAGWRVLMGPLILVAAFLYGTLGVIVAAVITAAVTVLYSRILARRALR